MDDEKSMHEQLTSAKVCLHIPHGLMYSSLSLNIYDNSCEEIVEHEIATGRLIEYSTNTISILPDEGMPP